MTKELFFPPNFLWGSAVSAYQVEEDITNCDWSQKFPAGRACNYYQDYQKYFDIAKQLNQSIHRFSLEWSRIEPQEGQFDQTVLQHYKRILKALQKRNIKSMVTLWHFTTPEWLNQKGGWANKQAVKYFQHYTKTVTQVLGEDVDYWITINEPGIYVSQAYILQRFVPQKKSLVQATQVIFHLYQAHKQAYQTIKDIQPTAQIGLAENYSCTEAGEKNQLNKYIVKVWDYIRNFAFLEATLKYQDFIGVNYYFHERIFLKKSFPFVYIKNKNQKVSDLGWEIYPIGIYKVLKRLKRYQKPIFITENGLADKEDKFRESFIVEHLKWVHAAIEIGVNVQGYLHWSLLDNFEWVDGYGPRFGLVEMNYDDLTTKIRPSAYKYATICKDNSLKI